MKPIRRLAIQASSAMSRGEYESARRFMEDKVGITNVPHPADLLFGCLIGAVTVESIVTKSQSLWWMGPRGLILTNPVALEEPIRCAGALGYFEWKRADLPAVEPLQWMRRWGGIGAQPVPLPEEAERDAAQPDLWSQNGA